MLARKIVVAISAVLDIAYHGPTARVSANDIAKRQNIPRRYLEGPLQKLVRAGILTGARGPNGGYQLARERRNITLRDIACTIDETVDPRQFMPSEARLDKAALDPIWLQCQKDIYHRLERTTIEDLCRDAKAAGLESGEMHPFDFSI